MNDTTTLQAVQQILQTNFALQPAALTPDARLDALDIDSLSVVEVLFEVEDKFGITVPSDTGAARTRLQTIGDLAAFVDGLIASQHPAAAGAAGPASPAGSASP